MRKLFLVVSLLCSAVLKDSKTEIGFAWQASPVGIEIGNNQVSGFLEGGFGYQGMVIAGVRFGL